MLIVFIGPPGAGKGTASRKLLDYLQIPHLSTGELLRAAKQNSPLGRLAAQYMDRGQLVPIPSSSAWSAKSSTSRRSAGAACSMAFLARFNKPSRSTIRSVSVAHR